MGSIARTRLKRLESAWYGLWNRGPAIEFDDRDPDPEVVSLVETPFETVAGVRECFDRLERVLREKDDRRSVFLTIYARVTEVIGERIEAGRFNDPDWVTEYQVTFANYYRRAVYDYERGRVHEVPVPWRIALSAAEHEDTLYLQDAMLGINAHINYDLALAIDEVATRPDRAAKYEDHCAIMAVLDRLVDDAQDRLAEQYADGLATIDESLGRIDEWLSAFTIAEARDDAWDRAVALDSRFRTRQRLARWFNHLISTGAAYLILSPTESSRAASVLREIEEGGSDGG